MVTNSSFFCFSFFFFPFCVCVEYSLWWWWWWWATDSCPWGLVEYLGKWWLLISAIALFGWYVHQVFMVWVDYWLCCIGTRRIVLVHAHTYSLVHTKHLHRGMCYEAIALLVSLTLLTTARVQKHSVHDQTLICFFFYCSQASSVWNGDSFSTFCIHPHILDVFLVLFTRAGQYCIVIIVSYQGFDAHCIDSLDIKKKHWYS